MQSKQYTADTPCIQQKKEDRKSRGIIVFREERGPPFRCNPGITFSPPPRHHRLAVLHASALIPQFTIIIAVTVLDGHNVRVVGDGRGAVERLLAAAVDAQVAAQGTVGGSAVGVAVEVTVGVTIGVSGAVGGGVGLARDRRGTG